MSLSLFTALLIMTFTIAFAVVYVWFMFYTAFWSDFKGAPFVPSQKKRIHTMVALAEIKAGKVCYDLGSGNGAVLFEAAKQGADARGIEINPFLVWFTRLRIKKSGLSNVAVSCADFRNVPLFDADVVFLYLWPSTNASLREKLLRELKPGSVIISNAFTIEGMMPEKIEDSVYRYKIS